jgi:hypothetical protein
VKVAAGRVGTFQAGSGCFGVEMSGVVPVQAGVAEVIRMHVGRVRIACAVSFQADMQERQAKLQHQQDR